MVHIQNIFIQMFVNVSLLWKNIAGILFLFNLF